MNVIRKRVLCVWLKTNFSTSPDALLGAEKLKRRSVLAIEGSDAESFLQELTTNDVRHLDKKPSIFTFFLNGRGKVIHDAILYKGHEDVIYVECDMDSIQALEIHMKMFKARKNVSIKNVEHQLSAWAVFKPKDAEYYVEHREEFLDGNFKDDGLDDIDLGDSVIVSRDPRLWPLGLRILAPKDLNIIQAIKNVGLKITSIPSFYKTIRYKLGVGEGSSEVGYGSCLPAEVNGDFLHGIDLKKGNFIGFVPEVGKKRVDIRLMPLRMRGSQANEIPVNTPIEDERKTAPVGYLRGLQGTLGLGLINIARAFEHKNVRIGKTIMKVLKPPWWESSK